MVTWPELLQLGILIVGIIGIVLECRRESQPNRAAYLKRLIREDMARNAR